ncbi:MAG TPA: methyltransferase domain-containing protein [Rhizomicrobium sp.]|nr:methyltransferase domain-containing protein [Rhizomicrobium sp.]
MNKALCIHFGTCGGCSYQDMPDDAYRALKRDLVVRALAGENLADAVVEEIVTVPPRSRRRAALKAEKRKGETHIGFNAARSHDIVDMRECFVLTPELFAFVQGARAMMNAILHDGEKAELHLTQADNGIDMLMRWPRKTNPAVVSEIAKHAAALNLVRVTANGEPLLERGAPVLKLGKAEVRIPPDAFLQPTLEGEGALQSRVADLLTKSKAIADLFCGAGTFTFPLAERARVLAVDGDKPMVEALANAARNTQGLKPVTVEKRDLFKQPMLAEELKSFDAAVLDPPRAGAQALARELAKSKVVRIAYVSCNAESFARDARILVDGGYRMGPVTPVDQFLWSAHVELIAGFTRPRR